MWTSSLKREVNHVDEEDGCFFMPLNAFRHFFSSYHIGYYHDNFHYSYVEDSNESNHARYYHFFITE